MQIGGATDWLYPGVKCHSPGAFVDQLPISITLVDHPGQAA
jgi:hypothetical protein